MVRQREGGVLQSAELRLVLALAVAACALALGVLSFARGRSSLFLLDFREWRPVSDPARFDRLQTGPPERRPFRLTLGLEGQAGSEAVERDLPAEPGRTYCFRVLTSPAEPYAPDGFRVAVSINGAVAWEKPLKGTGRGYAVFLPGLHAQDGRIRVRLEVKSPRAQASPAVYFDYASLRECGPEARR